MCLRKNKLSIVSPFKNSDFHEKMMVSHYKKKEIPVKRGVEILTFSHVMPVPRVPRPRPCTAARGLALRLHACLPIGFAAGLLDDLIHH